MKVIIESNPDQFPEKIKKQRYDDVKGKCEKCGKPFPIEECDAHHKHSIKSGGSNAYSNCKILCKPCHKKTLTYGKH